MGVATLERAPGLREPWLGYWRVSLRAMKDAGSWSLAVRPLLDEYIAALRMADVARLAAGSREFVEGEARTFAHPGIMLADRESRRALMLADALGLTPRAAESADAAADPFAELDELAPRRAARGPESKGSTGA